MPELRKDPVTRRWVIIASERGKRPSDFVKTEIVENNSGCPFCEGREKMTPPEVLSYREVGTDNDTPGWTTRVVPDSNPLLSPVGDLERRGISIYDKMNTFGFHEIVVETAEHNQNILTMEPWHIEKVLWAYKERINEIKKDDRIDHVLMVKNFGHDSGSRFQLVHPHSHILGFPAVPKRVVDKFRGAKKFFEYRERCIWCDMLLQEKDLQDRVIMENEHFLSFCPFASRFPFEAMIVPKTHRSHYEELTNEEIVHLAHILKHTVGKIFKALSSPSFNYIFFTAPWEVRYEEHFHWHIEIMPRVTGIAGFEWGTGFYINPTSPEAAAEILREIEI